MTCNVQYSPTEEVDIIISILTKAIVLPGTGYEAVS